MSEQSMKEGMKDLVVAAMENGGSQTFPESKISTDEMEITFDIVIMVKEVNVFSKQKADQP